MGARHYDPELRKFLQPDIHILENPEKGVQDPYQLHLNNYARNNPLKYTDPEGEFIPLIAIGVGLGLIFNPIEMGEPDEDLRVAKETAFEAAGGKVIGKVASYAKPIVKRLGKVIKTGLGKVAGYVERKFGGVASKSGSIPDKVFSGNALKQVTPGTKSINHSRYNPKTGKLEKSRVHYDKFGRQSGRTDYTDHGFPKNHTNPHHHKTNYGKEFPYGKSTRGDGPLIGD